MAFANINTTKVEQDFFNELSRRANELGFMVGSLTQEMGIKLAVEFKGSDGFECTTEFKEDIEWMLIRTKEYYLGHLQRMLSAGEREVHYLTQKIERIKIDLGKS